MELKMQKLTRDDRSRLRSDFIVPLILSRICEGLETLDDIAEYTIHDMIGDLKPDCGLLCLALCASEVAMHYTDIPMAATLALESERIIGEFGSLWLQHGHSAPPEALPLIRESLAHIPEDLEVLADLLDATQAELPEENIKARVLCDMLALQARVHAEEATDELLNINLTPTPRTPVPEAVIIPFPARH